MTDTYWTLHAHSESGDDYYFILVCDNEPDNEKVMTFLKKEMPEEYEYCGGVGGGGYTLTENTPVRV